jgi:hypothetical protein
MKRLAAMAVVLAALAAAGAGTRSSSAQFAATSSNKADVFAASADFNTVAVALADPGTPVQGTITLSATASSERGIASVAFQRSPAGAGTWTTICTRASAPYSCSFDSTAAADGSTDLRAVATDSAGYTRTSLLTRTIDNLGPTVTLSDPGTYLQGTVNLTMNATDAVGLASWGIRYRATGSSTWTSLCTSGALPRTCPLTTGTLTDGNYDLQATATDTGGHTATSTTLTRTVDNTVPSTTMTDPGTPLRGTVGLNATAADPGSAASGLASVAIQYGTGGSWTTVCTRTSSPASCSLNTTTVTDGVYDVRSLATDRAGNTATSTVTSRRIDNTAPTSTVTDPGAALHGTVTVTGTPSDAGSGVASWVLQRRPSSGGSWTTICTSTTSPYSCSWNTTTLTDGLYDLQAITTDAAGNATTSATVASRRVDNTNPAVSLSDPGSPKSGTFALSATASDAGSGLSSVVFQRRVTGSSTWTTICTVATAPFTCSFTSTAVPDDSYDFQALATDAAGNTATSVVGARLINNTAPQPTDVNADNGPSGTLALPEAGDTIEFDFNEALQPSSVLSGWNGAAGTAVTVRMIDNGNTDSFEVWDAANTTQSRLTSGGDVLAKKLVTANVTFNATIAQPTTGAYVITLGTIRSGSASNVTLANAVNLSWPAAAGFLDLTGTASAAKTVTGTKIQPF